MKKVDLFNRILGEIQESESAFMNHIEEDEITELASKITDGVFYLLIDNIENVESLFDIDKRSSEQPDVVVIDDLKEEDLT